MRIFLLFFLILFSAQSFAAESKILGKSSTAWDGSKFKYKKGTPEISVELVTIKAGDVMEFHCHPVPSAAYVRNGTLEVELQDGKKQLFKRGEALIEVMNKLHRGINLSSNKDVELIVFYAGVKESPNVIETKKANCSQ